MDERPLLCYNILENSRKTSRKESFLMNSTKQKRIADYGIAIGSLPKGPLNKITDVPGVKVGHCTVATEEHNTGVTVILPCADNLFANKLPAAAFVWNGFGKTAGLAQVEELGTLECPIALTNTLNVGLVHDALVEYMVGRCEKDGVPMHSINPVVGECNDSGLSNISHRAIGRKEVFAAIDSACADFAEGAVGAGRGTICHGLKGGIGSASRQIELDGKTYTLGVLVQSNYGKLADFTLCGRLIGPKILEEQQLADVNVDKGSIMMIVATDLPASDRQLRRIIKRCSVGLARLGSYVGHGSGEIMIGFTTAARIRYDEPCGTVNLPILNENKIDLAFRAAAEATEEAVLNSMICAEPVSYQGKTRHSLGEYEKYLG